MQILGLKVPVESETEQIGGQREVIKTPPVAPPGLVSFFIYIPLFFRF